MDCSFILPNAGPDGNQREEWFVFRSEDGSTVRRGFKTKAQAVTWIHSERSK